MYLLNHSSVVEQNRLLRFFSRVARKPTPDFDFITPDGQLVPSAIGQLALNNNTAVLIGGLLVGVWAKSE